MNIGIGAIFRDEFDYIIEWLAWHQLAGFEYFYIADNGSTDGTLALLEALETCGYIKLVHQPIVEKNAQIKAYEKILQLAIGNSQAVFFIDADEFICHDSFRDGEELRSAQALLTPSDVGALALTWRLFGSSGNLNFEDRPVVERFTKHADYESSKLIKSAVKVGYVQSMSVHYARLQSSVKYVDASAKFIDDFITFKDGNKVLADVSGMRESACSQRLMINHYVVKSKQEFVEKKVKRGDAMLGVDYERSMDFFKEHDRNDCEFHLPARKIERLKRLMRNISIELDAKTAYGRVLRGHIDVSNENKIVGWVVDDLGISKSLEVKVFVNGSYVGSTSVGYFREDLKDKEISVDGMAGFAWSHSLPLRRNDIVEVKIRGNKFSFSNGRTIIP